MSVLMSIASADLSTTLNSAVTNIAVALIGLVGAYAMLYINKATKKIQAETDRIKDEGQRQLLHDATYRLRDVAYMTVSSIEQTTAGAIRQLDLSEGEKKKQLEQLSLKACKEIMDTLGKEYREVLEASIEDIDTYVVNVIEDSVRQVKSDMK